MTEHSLNPYADPYPGQLTRIRKALDLGVTVYVEHNEFATRKQLVLAPLSGMTQFESPHLGDHEWYLLSWVNTGSMWVPLNDGVDAAYVAEKLNIRRWWMDAESIAAFTESLARRSVVEARRE